MPRRRQNVSRPRALEHTEKQCTPLCVEDTDALLLGAFVDVMQPKGTILSDSVTTGLDTRLDESVWPSSRLRGVSGGGGKKNKPPLKRVLYPAPHLRTAVSPAASAQQIICSPETKDQLFTVFVCLAVICSQRAPQPTPHPPPSLTLSPASATQLTQQHRRWLPQQPRPRLIC